MRDLLMRRAVYIAHPLRGKTGSDEEIRRNRDAVDRICRNLRERYPGMLLISPLHAFSFCSAQGCQEWVMRQCRALIAQCVDEVWLFGDWRESVGCVEEVEWARKINVPVVDVAEVNDEILRRLT